MEDLLDNPDTTLLPVNVTEVAEGNGQGGVWSDPDELVLLTDSQGLGFSDDFVEDVIVGIYGITNFNELINRARFQLNIHAVHNVIGYDFSRRYSMDVRKLVVLGLLYQENKIKDLVDKNEPVSYTHLTLPTIYSV